MTSRTPRDSRLRLVPHRPIAGARRAVPQRGTRPAPRPPEGTPPPAELARHARASLAGAARVARWAAAEPDGEAAMRPGAYGALSDVAADRAADALGLTPLQVRTDWDRARLSGLIELHGGTARAGWRLRAWDRDDSAVLRGWVALFDAWSIARPWQPDGRGPATRGGADPAAVAEVIEAVPQLLSVLQLSAGPMGYPDLLDLLRKRVAELRTERCEVPYGQRAPQPGPARTERSALTIAAVPEQAPQPRSDAAAGGTETRADLAAPPAPGEGARPAAVAAATECDVPEELLAWALDGLAEVGALVVREAAGAAHREAELTALGNWAVWVKLEQICVAAQSPAGNIEQHAEDMLRGCAQLTPGPARAEYRAWLAARPVGSAVTELLDAARGDDALLRGLAFEALRVVGAPAEPAVRAALDESRLRPYALLWLAEIEGADPEDTLEVLTREEATWLWVDTAAAIADHGEISLLVRHLESAVQGTVPALLAEVREVGHPRTVQVLVALAAAHPDPALAKAVRRAAFQVHTGGT
ncbi:hypothetical protein ACMA1D_01650 [Streptomyces sp. 796.1]|uniref:hypothetical protein n=1 Tax=Streptomyces sp. 796.1 TaxID=3163029 RepID=UPI0039C99925